MRGVPKTLSLRAILVLFALAIVLPAAIGAGALVAWNTAERRAGREAELLAVARAVSTSINLRMAEMVMAAGAIATSESVQGHDWTEARRRLERLELGPSTWVAISDRAGRRLLNTNPVAASRPGRGLPRPPGVVRAVRTNRPQISGIFVGSSTGRPVVAVDRAVPADPEEKVVSLIVDATALSELANRQLSPNEAFVTLVDQGHRVIARTEGQARFVGVPATADMARAMRRSASGVVSSRSLDGKPTVVAYTRSDLTGWTTMVVLPRAAFVRPILESAVTFALLGGLMLLLGVGGARLVGRLISRELEALEADALALGKGVEVRPRLGSIEVVNTVQAAISQAGAELSHRRARQELMINELNHRVKNTLATVQGLAAQTFRGSDQVASRTFADRLAALAGAHDLLTGAEWTRVDVTDVVARSCAFAERTISTSGPSVMLPSQAAFGLCLCLHELITNSMKYGSLSVDAGSVLLTWEWADEPEELHMTWREVDGPLVVPPTRRGFGTRLIDRLVGTELHGKTTWDFAPSGLVFQGVFKLTGSARWRTDLSG